MAQNFTKYSTRELAASPIAVAVPITPDHWWSGSVARDGKPLHFTLSNDNDQRRTFNVATSVPLLAFAAAGDLHHYLMEQELKTRQLGVVPDKQGELHHLAWAGSGSVADHEMQVFASGGEGTPGNYVQQSRQPHTSDSKFASEQFALPVSRQLVPAAQRVGDELQATENALGDASVLVELPLPWQASFGASVEAVANVEIATPETLAMPIDPSTSVVGSSSTIPPLSLVQMADAANSVEPGNGVTEIDTWDETWRGMGFNWAGCGMCAGGACSGCAARSNAYGTGAGDGSSPLVPVTNGLSDEPSLLATVVPPNPNRIVLENQLPGTPESIWGINGAGSSNIEGFATSISVDNGQTVSFKINTNATRYSVDIYRLGYYQGNGARLVDTININRASPQVQPVPLFDPEKRLVDAGNWSVSASWNVPSDAVSGVYFARLTRTDGVNGENIIPFIVRDDEAPSEITFQTSDTTWQAYNWWGGYNFYGSTQGGIDTRSYAVSYNRPIITRGGGIAAGPQDFVFSVEYPTIRWLEENGYDVNYISGVDTARDGAQLLNSDVFLSVGHDEYWSGSQRANVEAARDAGVNLAFLSGNEVYWRTRWEDSIDASNTPYRTLVSYKETWGRAKIDPSPEWTGTWRDPRYASQSAGAGLPENALTGTLFTVDSYRLDTIEIPYVFSRLRFWRDTSIANLAPGQVGTLVPNLLGYEWNSDLDNGFRPAGLVPLSSTTLEVDTLLLDYGNTVGPGVSSHALTLYRAPSGALVFGAGTVYWSWGLDDNHDLEATPTDPNVQQAMVNLFADMGVQPQTLAASLRLAQQSTDLTAPNSTVAPLTGTYQAQVPTTITGTATDTGGGVVAVVEVSTDNGATWHRASGYENWSYTWTPTSPGTYTVRSRAVDDSINMEAPGPGRTVSVGAPSFYRLFTDTVTPSTVDDGSSVELGMKFTSSTNGTITGLRYYKAPNETGTHVGTLWSSTGTVLGRATFSNETASGWQSVTFSSPVAINPGTTYIASYHSNGSYAATTNYFNAAVTSGPLTAPSTTQAGGNGVYRYGTSSVFPNESFIASNYWVDVNFVPTSSGQNTPPVAVNDSGIQATVNTALVIQASTLLANDTDANGDPLSITSVTNGTGGTVSFNATTNIVTFTPAANFTGAANFNYAISDGRGGTASATASVTVNSTAPPTFVRLFSDSAVPAILSENDGSSVELGMKFTSSVNGTITGLRYYKGANDTGTHVGTLWSSTGAVLGRATFTNETASGWQAVTFSSPVAITAGTTYVASYHSNGFYTANTNYFGSAVTSGPLTAPSSTQSGGNGVYRYGATPVFPDQSFQSSNYWVDVTFVPAATGTNTPPVAVNDTRTVVANGPNTIAASLLLANDTDANGDVLSVTGVSNPVNGTAAFNAQTNAVTFTPTTGYTGPGSFQYAISDGRGGISSATVNLTVAANTPPVAVNDSGIQATANTALAIQASTLLANDTDANADPLSITSVTNGTGGTVSFNATANVVTFTPTANFTGAANFNYAISDGRGGTASATASVTVNTTAPPTFVRLFSDSAVPAILSENDGSSVELGMKFTSSVNGTITGLRYYKGANDTGTHVGTLWSSTGAVLGRATFTNETASGWQAVTFSSPVAITAGTTYVASYHSNGFYTANTNYFGSAVTSGPLTAPSSTQAGGNGVYRYGATPVFPDQSFQSSNYWVDVTFVPAATGTNTPPVAVNDTRTVVANGSNTIAASLLLANDTDANGDVLSVTGVSNPVNGTAAFNAQTNAVTFTPTTGYTGPGSFQYAISDGRGGISSATVNLTVAANTPPVAVNDSGIQATANTALAIQASTLLANDTDANADPLSITSVTNGTGGTVSFNATANVVTFTPTANFTGAANFNYAISDGRGGTASATASVTVNTTAPPAGQSIFASTATPALLNIADGIPVELGMKFQADVAGTISAIKFYKGTGNTGNHEVSLWSSTGQRLGSTISTAANETASGWQTVNLAQPVPIAANSTYIASYHSNGTYSATENFFANAVTNGNLRALSNAQASGNGVYAYAGAGTFPTETYQQSNYWVDVVFNPQLAS